MLRKMCFGKVLTPSLQCRHLPDDLPFVPRVHSELLQEERVRPSLRCRTLIRCPVVNIPIRLVQELMKAVVSHPLEKGLCEKGWRRLN